MMKDYGFETNSIHGYPPHTSKKAINQPIFMTSSFYFDSLEEVENTFGREEGNYVYTRGNNPTIKPLEKKMARLAGGEGAVAFSSGMAAISTLLFSLLNSGDKALAHNVLYGSSYNLLKNIMPEKGIEVEFVDLNEESLESMPGEEIDLIYFETPVNPTLEIIDISAITDYARKHNIKTVIDNTFATPYLQRPLQMGADYTVHSATKYISGHGDAVGGLVISRDAEHLKKLRFKYMSDYGGVMSPFNAWLILRGLKTLKLRMDKHQQNARRMAEYLNKHSGVNRVNYPGLKKFTFHKTAGEQMEGFGGMLSFELKMDLSQIRQFIKKLDLIKLAVSLGDAETLIEIPFHMTHRDYSREELNKMNISSNLVRISAGLENTGDLLADLDQALN